MEIVRITDGDYAQYEELLLRRDRLEKEASAAQLEYIREFGEAVTAVFQEKLECIALRKAIAFCQQAKNRGDAADPAALQAYLDVHMASYYAELQDMLARNSAAKGAVPISDYQAEQVKRIYRRLAKLLHPDISPLTRQDPELMQLFQEVLTAYRGNQLQRLQELEVLIRKKLDELGGQQLELVIEDIAGKTEALEEEIQTILTTEPYTYRELLADAFAVEEKKQALEKELEDYRRYHAELQKLLDGLQA